MAVLVAVETISKEESSGGILAVVSGELVVKNVWWSNRFSTSNVRP